MAGMEFEYDEKGGTFYYFLLSFLALILFPATFYLWSRKEIKEDNDQSKRTCHCEHCQAKKQILNISRPQDVLKKKAVKICLIVGWVVFALLVYKVSTLDIDFTEYDPFVELAIDRGASRDEIRKAYRQLSKIYHPDKDTGDSKKFMRIAKAYAALTDEESRKNWEEYGNPDGPGATQFGIALPKWIVEKQNSMWVLAAYGLAFMIILPLVVGTWWYRSIKYSSDEVLLDTQQLFFFFFHKTPNMVLKRVIMILSGAFEFERGHNSEVVERESDNEEVPILIRDLQHTQLGDKNKEKPLCFPYSVKTRVLLHAHVSRLEMPPKTLEQDKLYIIKKCPYLISEMISTVAQLVSLAHAGRVSHMPRLETIENCMKVNQMLTQALWDSKSPLLQLPHISEDMLRHFVTRKRNVRSIKQFASLKEEDRRALLRTLTDDEYRDVINVCATMPYIEMTVKSEVLDDEDTSITAGSIVTLTVTLVRHSLEAFCGIELPAGDTSANQEVRDNIETVCPEGQVGEDGPEETVIGDKEKNVMDSLHHKTNKVWEKNKKKTKSKNKPSKNKKKPPVPKTVALVKKSTCEIKETGEQNTVNGDLKQRKKKRHSDSDENSEDESEASNSDSEEADDKQPKEEEEDDDDDWKKFQEQSKKENSLDTKSKESHLVHCPHFPLEKHEWWWLYVADKKNHVLISAPMQVCNLKDMEELQVKFSAPPKQGTYNYSVCLKSDSYMDFDITQNVKLDVKEAKKIESHPQWDISDDEENKGEDENSESDISSDDEEYSD